MRPDLQEALGKKYFLVHGEDDDLQGRIFFQQIGSETKRFGMRHINVQYQQIKAGGTHFFDHSLSVFGFIDGYIPDAAIV